MLIFARQYAYFQQENSETIELFHTFHCVQYQSLLSIASVQLYRREDPAVFHPVLRKHLLHFLPSRELFLHPMHVSSVGTSHPDEQSATSRALSLLAGGQMILSLEDHDQ